MLLIDELLLQNIYFVRNMHKDTLFLLKNCKNCSALGAPLPDSQWLPGGPATPHIEKSWLRHCLSACITDSQCTEGMSSFTFIVFCLQLLRHET